MKRGHVGSEKGHLRSPVLVMSGGLMEAGEGVWNSHTRMEKSLSDEEGALGGGGGVRKNIRV